MKLLKTMDSTLHWQNFGISQNLRSAAMHQQAQCIWFTGLSGSGKSTLANLLEQHFHGQGLHTYLLDGDNLRQGLCSDLGFTNADRTENVRRVSHVARLMVDAGLVVIVSLISPFRKERDAARQLFAIGEFLEVFVDTELHVCEQRDTKGLYSKARRGELPNFTGIDSPYEPPESSEIHLRCGQDSVSDTFNHLLREVHQSQLHITLADLSTQRSDDAI